MKFIETAVGKLVNVDHITHIEHRNGQWRGVDRQGFDFAIRDCEIRKLTNQIVPARAGDTAIICTYDPGAAGDVFVEHQPIAAWQIFAGPDNLYAEPVLICDLSDDQLMGILCPDGSVVGPLDFSYESVESFVAGSAKYFRESRALKKTLA